MGVDMSFDGLQWLGGPFPDTEEVTSSNLVTPTTTSQVMGSSEPVACFCSKHLDELLRYGHIEASTHRAYCYLLKHVEEFFPATGISDVEPDMMRGFVHFLASKRLAPGTVRKTYNLLAMCVKQAHAEGLVTFEPSKSVCAPKNRCPPPNPLTSESLERMLRNLESLDRTPCVIACYIALYTGMRRGEICALRWEDIDLQGRTARVRRSIAIKDKGTYIKGTKTGTERVVPLVPELVPILKERRWRMVDMCHDRGADFRSTFYVIGDADGAYLSPYRVTRWWGMHSEEWHLYGTQNRKCAFHDLRHTFATIAVRRLDLKTAQSIMGHASAEMTMRYADTELSQVQAASNTLGGAFSVGN